ncbi:MAG: zf-HC2 domain-containing protein [Armatimonadota bacterium]
MNCEAWREIASDHTEGTLPAARRAEADRHIAECAACRSDHAFLTGFPRILRASPEPETPLFLADNVVSRIEAEQRARLPWHARLGRIGIATLMVGSAAAGMLWSAWFPDTNRGLLKANPAGGVVIPSAQPAPAAPGTLAMEWSRRVDAEDPALDVTFTLGGSEKGTARCDLPGDPNPYRLPLSGGVPQTLRVPVAAARGDRTVAVRVRWNSGDGPHDRRLAIPVPGQDQAPAVRQSFGLPEMPADEALRELARRYGVPVVADELPAGARLAPRAVDDTMESVVRKAVEPLGWRVEARPDRLVVVARP